jgi:cell division protein FtsN
MSHDFARSHRPSARPVKKKKASKGVPQWAWTLGCTLAGALIMYLIYAAGYAPTMSAFQKNASVNAPELATEKTATAAQVNPNQEPPAPPKRTSPVFEFYTKLPAKGAPSVDSHALPDAQTAAVMPAQTAPTVAAPDASTDLDPIQQLLAQQAAAKQQKVGVPSVNEVATDAPAPAPVESAVNVKKETKVPAATKSPGRYALQAGAFRKRSEADTLRAKLLMLGVQASILQMTNDKGESLHKVIAGPFASAADMDDAKIILGGNHINTIPLK